MSEGSMHACEQAYNALQDELGREDINIDCICALITEITKQLRLLPEIKNEADMQARLRFQSLSAAAAALLEEQRSELLDKRHNLRKIKTVLQAYNSAAQAQSDRPIGKRY